MTISPLYRWIEQHPIVSFYVLAFFISWLGMIPKAAHSWRLISIQNSLFAYLGAGRPAFYDAFTAYMCSYENYAVRQPNSFVEINNLGNGSAR